MHSLKVLLITCNNTTFINIFSAQINETNEKHELTTEDLYKYIKLFVNEQNVSTGDPFDLELKDVIEVCNRFHLWNFQTVTVYNLFSANKYIRRLLRQFLG